VAKFKFNYETLIRYRETRLLLAKKEMFAVESKIRQLSDEMTKCLESRRVMIEESHANTGSTIEKMQLAADLVDSQSRKLKILTHQILTEEKELDRHKNWVAHLGRELKIIEKLKEKQKEKFEHEARTREAKKSDEWVSQDWVQKMIKEENLNLEGRKLR
jgi:flagellar FliJ protein